MEPARAVFVSDAHLGDPASANYVRMLAFLDGLSDLSDLFILGDFFAFWMGFSRVPVRYRPLVDRLAALAAKGVRLHYVEGNHDIDVGRYFARRLGADVHPDGTEVTLGGQRVLLTHGDLADPNDRGYRFLRRFLRSLPLKWLSRTLPPEAVLAIARPFAGHAPEAVARNTGLPGVLREAARHAWGRGYDGVIMGHCHAPEFLEETVDGRPRFYANLGDWLTHFTYLAFDGKGFRLEHFA